MNVIAINGSPRKGWNTEKLLKEALKGAESVGAETKLIHLYDLNYTGCRSCFACKVKGNESSLCAFKDELTPVLEEIFHADVVLLGSPIYFGDVTGQMISFIERLRFPLLSYDDYSKKLFHGSINAAFFFTMNTSGNLYQETMQTRASFLKEFGGNVETYASYDTYQFGDYTMYHTASFDEKHKRKLRDEQFPKDLNAAFDIGCRLAKTKK